MRFEYKERGKINDKDPDYTNYLNECNELSRRYFCEGGCDFSWLTEDTVERCLGSWER